MTISQGDGSISNRPLRLLGHRDTSWSELGVMVTPNGARGSWFTLGDETDSAAPVVFNVSFPPDCRIAPHTHDTDYAEIIIEGSQKVGRRWYRVGDIRIVSAGHTYGPLIAGPDGMRAIIIYRDDRWTPVTKRTGSQEGLYTGALDQLPKEAGA
jgi:hypothetical protein